MHRNDNIILRTKLHRPAIGEDLIARPHLLELLQNGRDKPVSLVCAPAGYGKSILVSRWLEECQFPHTWLSLDEEHNNLRIFFLYLQAAVEKLFPGAFKETRNLFQSVKLPPIKVITYSVINDLDRINEDFILVLDDYQHIQNDKIHYLVNELCHFPPEHLHLSILSRIDPPLKLNVLSANGRMTELRMNELAFNDAEIAELFLKLHHRTLKKETVAALYNKTEGWIVGLRIVLLAIREIEDADQIIANLQGDSYSLSRYLIEEVIAQQSERIQDLLLKTAILDRFSAELIDAIDFGEEYKKQSFTGTEFVQWLLKSNLFIVELDDQRKWFRYHHLFQELLQAKLKEQKTDIEISRIHAHASNCFEQLNLIKEAIRHMLASGNAVEACNIVERHRMDELNDDRWYVVQLWLEMLPEELRQQRPHLLLSQAWIEYESFQLDRIPAILEQVKLIIDKQEEDQALAGEMYLFHGVLDYWGGEGKKSQNNFEKARALLPDHRKLIGGFIELTLSWARYMTGQKELALNELTKLQVEGKGSGLYHSRLVGGFLYIHLFSGDLMLFRKECQYLQDLAKRHDLRYTNAMGICLEAGSYFHEYELEEAFHHFSMAAQKRYIMHKRTAIDGLAGQVITEQLMQKTADADKSLDFLDSFIADLNEPQFEIIGASCRARLALLRGDVTSALKWEKTVSEAPAPSEMFAWLEIPIITQVRVLIAHGIPESLSKAASLLNEFLSMSKKCRFVNQTIEGLVLQALLLKKQGDMKEALKIMNEVVFLAGSGNWIRPFIEAGPEMADLLNHLPESESRSSFLERVRKKFKNIAMITNEDLLVQKEEIHKSAQDADMVKVGEKISLREREIIGLMSSGLRNKEIADKLFVAEGTIKRHIHNICQKMNVTNRIGLLNAARKFGFTNTL